MNKVFFVAPYVGAWIETVSDEMVSYQASVAPYVGAWIETSYKSLSESLLKVAPYVGAWIETSKRRCRHRSKTSHPMWVRGLKPVLLVSLSVVRCRTLCGCVD